MDASLERELQKELRSGERLLWSGRPWTGVRFIAGDILMIPFSLLWGGFALYWEAAVVRGGAPLLFKLWGIPFVAVGLYMIAGRFFWAAHRRAKTIYGLTDRRVIIISSAWPRRVESVSLATLPQIAVAEHGKRRGTIVLGNSGGLAGMFAASGWPGGSRNAAPRLEGVQDPRDVQDRILKAEEECRRLAASSSSR